MHSRPSGSEPALPAIDPLATVIELLRPQGVFSKVITGSGRWSVRYAAYEDPAFCLMLQGSCFLDADGIGTIELREGDFALLPATPSFTMASDLSLAPKPMAPTYVEEIRHGTQSGPPTLRMLGGYFGFDRANAQLLVSFLPPLVLIRDSEEGATRMRRIVELIAEETVDRRPARDLILERLIQILLLEALRVRSSAAVDEQPGLLAGLADPPLARALRGIHEDVARRWTVASLARAAGMSRAVFAERFMHKVGMPPMRYVLEWRIALAKELLLGERPPLAEIAERIGYQSASAFSVAFSRHVGCAPSAFARSPAA